MAPRLRPRTSGRSPRARPSRSRASAGRTRYGSGKGADTITSGLEGAWTTNPVKWDNNFLENLYGHEWELTTSPAGAKQWAAQGEWIAGRHGAGCSRSVEAARRHDAHDGPRAADGSRPMRRSRSASSNIRTSSKTPLPRRGTSCCTATWDPSRGTSARGFRSRSSGRTPFPQVDHPLINEQDIAALKGKILGVGTVRLAAGPHRLVVGRHLPRHRQAWRGQRRADPPRTSEGLGGERSAEAREGAADTGARPDGVQPLSNRRQEGLAR